MESPVKVSQIRSRTAFRAELPEHTIKLKTSRSTTDMTALEPNTSSDDDEEDEANYSVDIASAVAAILESAAREPLPEEPSIPRVLSAQASKSKKKILKAKSTKSIKPKRSKSTIYPISGAATAGSSSKSRISLQPVGTNANVAGRKSKSKTSIDALHLDNSRSRSFQAFDDDDTHSIGTAQGEREEAKPPGPNQLAVCGFRPFPPAPLPRHPNMLDVSLYIGRIIEYFKKLGYNTEGEPKIRVNTKLSLHTHTETARLLIKAGEQIKCLHALVLGIYFTNCTPYVERFTINFKSSVNGKEYKHIVLGLYMFGAFGALGISRDPRLQDKPTIFTRLADLLSNFCQSYAQCGHELLEIKVGGIISRDTHSLAPLPFRLGVLHMRKIPNEQQFLIECDKIGKLVRAQMGPQCLRQIRPPELCVPIPNFDDRKSLLSSTRTTTTLPDESSKLISKLREISNETAPKVSNQAKPTKPSTSSMKNTPSKKKIHKK